MKLTAVLALLASTVQGATIEDMSEQVHNLDAQLKAMDMARDEMVNTPTTAPEDDQDQSDDNEDEQMMDFEDELDKMEDAFEMVQHQYGADDAEVV